MKNDPTQKELLNRIGKLEKERDFLRDEVAQRFRLAAEIASDLIYEWDIKTDELLWYGDVDGALGYEPGEFGRDISSWIEAIHPEDCEKLEGSVEHHRNSTDQIDEEYRIKNKNGEWRHWTDRAMPVLDEERRPRKWVGVCTDVTERKKTLDELVRSERKYRAIVDSSPLGIFVTDGMGRYIEANKAGIEMTGYPEAELKKMSIPDIFDPEHLEAGLKHFMECQTTGQATGDLGFIKKDGTKYFMSVHAMKLSGERFMAISEDITERMLAGQELRRHHGKLQEMVEERTRELLDSEARYRRLAENLPDIIMRWIPNHGLDFANPAMERILGVNPEDFIGNWGSFMARVHPDDVQNITDAYQEMGQHKKDTQTTEYRFMRDDGRMIWLEAIWKPIWNEDGGLAAVEAIARDVTERKKAEIEHEKLQAQLIQSQKMEAIGTMAGGIAHDFNNILATINGTAEILLRSMPPGAPYYSKIERILNSGARAKELTMKLLTFARKEKLNISRTSLNRIVRDVIDMLEGTVSMKLKIVSRLDDNLPDVNVDSTQILQALLNISINACDAMPDGGVLEFHTEKAIVGAADETDSEGPSGDYCMASVIDSGEGLSEELRDKIFEPFFTTKERGKGSGLGLSVSHGIIQAHSGFINVEPGIDKGTVFRIYLPAMSPKNETEPLGKKEKPQQYHRGTILVVDDDPDFAQMTGDALEIEGFDSLVTLSGKDALATFGERKDQVDVVMLDMILPEMSGSQIFEELLKMDPAVNVVICSGYSREGDATKLLRKGARAYVQKPFSIDELCEVFSNIIGESIQNLHI